MHTDLALLDSAGATAVGLTDALSSAAGYALAEKAENTRRAYRSDLRAFSIWCASVAATALPASSETVAAYLAFVADSGLTVSTIQRRAAAIAYAHKLADCASPLASENVKAVLRGHSPHARRRAARQSAGYGCADRQDVTQAAGDVGGQA